MTADHERQVSGPESTTPEEVVDSGPDGGPAHYWAVGTRSA